MSGCEQNKCTLSNEDQVNGTRIIIEGPLDNEGKPMYDTIGVKSDGSPKEHGAFNVDQIRHISCNNNYSKPLEDDGTIKDIEIRCPVDGGEFVIDKSSIISSEHHGVEPRYHAHLRRDNAVHRAAVGELPAPLRPLPGAVRPCPWGQLELEYVAGRPDLKLGAVAVVELVDRVVVLPLMP